MQNFNEIFIGRKKEIDLMESLFNSKKFEMLILHGRRRVGKSYLLGHFAKLHQANAVYFTADKSSEKINVGFRETFNVPTNLRQCPKYCVNGEYGIQK